MPSIFPVIDLSYLPLTPPSSRRANSIREYQKSIDGRCNRAADYIRNLCPRKRAHSIDFHWVPAQRGVRNFIDQFCRDAERPFRFFHRSPPFRRPPILIETDDTAAGDIIPRNGSYLLSSSTRRIPGITIGTLQRIPFALTLRGIGCLAVFSFQRFYSSQRFNACGTVALIICVFLGN